MYSGDEEFGDDVTSGILDNWVPPRDLARFLTESDLLIAARKMVRRHPERDLEMACSGLLQLDGWRLLKTDPVSDRKRGKGFGEIGMADCLYLRYSKAPHQPWSEVLWIEWKAPGGQATALQRLWIAAEQARGALVWLAGANFPASVDGFLAHYRASGLMRRKL